MSMKWVVIWFLSQLFAILPEKKKKIRRTVNLHDNHISVFDFEIRNRSVGACRIENGLERIKKPTLSHQEL